jgi:hypothetical protein
MLQYADTGGRSAAYVAPGIEEAPWSRPETADVILKNSGAIIRTGGDRPSIHRQPTTSSSRLIMPSQEPQNGPPRASTS